MVNTYVVEQCLQAPTGHHGKPPWQWERRKDSLQDETHWTGMSAGSHSRTCTGTALTLHVMCRSGGCDEGGVYSGSGERGGWRQRGRPNQAQRCWTQHLHPGPSGVRGWGGGNKKYTTVFFFSGPEQEWTRCCTEKCVVVHLRFCVSACSRVYFCCQVQTFSHSLSTSASSASAPAASFRILITYLGVVVWGFFSFEPSPGFNFLHYRKLL